MYGDSGVCDWEALRLACIIRDIDRSVICPMFNYSSVEEYYNGTLATHMHALEKFTYSAAFVLF